MLDIMGKAYLFLLYLLMVLPTTAQTAAQMKLWDSHERHPQIWHVEFDGADSLLATYDAVYGHGPMVENETYALRVYAQPWPRIDLYGKRRSAPELSVTDFYTTPAQRSQGYGADALLVGETMGVGSLLGWDGSQPTPFNPVLRRGQRVLYSTPDSSAVEVYVKGWEYQGQNVDLTQRLTMRHGTPWTHVDVWVNCAQADSLMLSTGIQRLKNDLGYRIGRQPGCARTWGTNAPEPGDTIAVALEIRVPQRYLHQQIEASHSIIMVLQPVRGHLEYDVMARTSLQPGGIKE